MDNLGEYGYLIFLLLIYLARAIFGKKKPAKGAPKPAGRSLEDILGDLLEGEKPAKAQPQATTPPVSRPEAPSPPPVSRPSTVINTEAEPENEYMRYLREKGTKRNVVQDINPLEVVELDKPDDESYHFDVKQAIISQVILERKYS